MVEENKEIKKNTNLMTWSKVDLLEKLAEFDQPAADKYEAGTFSMDIKQDVIRLINDYEATPPHLLKEILHSRKVAMVEYSEDEAGIVEVKALDNTVMEVSEIEDNVDSNKELTKAEKMLLVYKETKRVIFPNGMDMGQTLAPYIFVGHNGRGFYIPKDKEVDVPVIILDSCIKDAIAHTLHTFAKEGRIVHEWKKVQRYPYNEIHK